MKISLTVGGIVSQLKKGDVADFPGWVDVTGKYVGVGFTDNGDGTFTDNDVPVEALIRKITTQAFYRRMTQGELASMRAGTSDVTDVREDLGRSPALDLDGTIEAQLQSIPSFNQTRIDELLVDGTLEETETG